MVVLFHCYKVTLRFSFVLMRHLSHSHIMHTQFGFTYELAALIKEKCLSFMSHIRQHTTCNTRGWHLSLFLSLSLLRAQSYIIKKETSLTLNLSLLSAKSYIIKKEIAFSLFLSLSLEC